jgi:hypothetical protein
MHYFGNNLNRLELLKAFVINHTEYECILYNAAAATKRYDRASV